jgi:maltooligosyltrehalose trehalohydrolase
VTAAYDEAARWLAFRRGDLQIAVNLSDAPAEIPLGGGRSFSVLSSWEPVSPPDAAGVLRLPPESAAILTDE